jgi:flavin-binding protein dodecin
MSDPGGASEASDTKSAAGARIAWKSLEVEATSRTDFAEATDQAIAWASELMPVAWFEVKRLGGRIENGKRSEYTITFVVGV